jgi:hypothetical protein
MATVIASLNLLVPLFQIAFRLLLVQN